MTKSYSNNQIISRVAGGARRFITTPVNMQMASKFGPHDCSLDLPIIIEASAKGVNLDSRLPPQTLRGNTGLGRTSTIRTEICRGLIARHGQGAVQWTGSNGGTWNSRLIRADLVREYQEEFRSRLGI